MTTDEEKVVSGGVSGELKVFDIETKKETLCFKKDLKQINCIKATIEDNLVLTCGSNKMIQLWDFKDKNEQIRINCNDYGSLYSLAIPSDYKVLQYKNLLKQNISNNKSGSVSINKTSCYVSCADGTILEWDFRYTSKPVNMIKAHSFCCGSIDIFPTTSYLVSASYDKTVSIVDTKKFKTLNVFKHHKERVTSAEWHPFFPIILSCSADKTIKLMGSMKFLSQHSG